MQGVPEKNSLAPFVHDFGGGKRGAYALMADGSVRWIPANTPDKIFQSMVTKDGGDNSGSLDADAPLVPPGGAAPPPPPK